LTSDTIECRLRLNCLLSGRLDGPNSQAKEVEFRSKVAERGSEDGNHKARLNLVVLVSLRVARIAIRQCKRLDHILTHVEAEISALEDPLHITSNRKIMGNEVTRKADVKLFSDMEHQREDTAMGLSTHLVFELSHEEQRDIKRGQYRCEVLPVSGGQLLNTQFPELCLVGERRRLIADHEERS